jgi:hypothetical protein
MSVLPNISDFNEPSNVIGFSETVHETSEFTDSGTTHQSNQFPFSTLPDLSHFNELSIVTHFSDVGHESRQFVQSASFSSRASVNELPEGAATSQGLSDGALVGIIVGVGSFLVLLICLIVLWLFRTKSSTSFDSSLADTVNPSGSVRGFDLSQLERGRWLE